ncbi:hypothetical protein LCGC14_2604370 [marine sediment metagenome]|uniref:Uncharacterized protein n=1 Tax=marine sediment metagenome TaxID=412755 RepID=A0A0F9A7R2_9ZZZZ
MKTFELFEQSMPRGAPGRHLVFVVIELSGLDPELDEENEAYRIFDKLGGRGVAEVVGVGLDPGTANGRVKFDSIQKAKQGLRILRRLSRGKPSFIVSGTSSTFHTGSTDTMNETQR